MTLEMFYQSVIERIRQQAQTERRLLVTIDGPCCSGKTTAAQQLAERFSASVLHTDDFVVPHSRKTPERLAVPGGNCDWERLTEEVLLPWKAGEAVAWQRYDCRHDCMVSADTRLDSPIVILEGSYCNLPAIRQLAGVRVFLDIRKERQMARLKQRETAQSLQRFQELWIPLEEAYFREYHLPDEGCMLFS